MPVNLKQYSKELHDEREQLRQKLLELMPYCELYPATLLINETNKLDIHEYWGQFSRKFSLEVNKLLLLHPANLIVIDHNRHISRKPSKEECLRAVLKRSDQTWLKLGFPKGGVYAVISFMLQLEKFYKNKILKTKFTNPDHTLVEGIQKIFNEIK